MKRTNDLLVGTIVLLVILTLTGATFWAKQTDIGDRRSKVVARFRDVGNALVLLRQRPFHVSAEDVGIDRESHVEEDDLHRLYFGALPRSGGRRRGEPCRGPASGALHWLRSTLCESARANAQKPSGPTQGSATSDAREAPTE